MINHGLTIEDADRLLDPIVDFPEHNVAFERVRPITDFRKDDSEARVLFICKRLRTDDVVQGKGELEPDRKDDLFVLKCKVQSVLPLSLFDYVLPLHLRHLSVIHAKRYPTDRAPSVLAGGLTTPVAGPSEHTEAELQALKTFADIKAPSLPHLVAWKKSVQGADGPMPGGYIVYIVMTLIPGQDIMALKFWSMTDAQKEEIREAFLPVIKHVWKLGFEPYDCALRNILWESETRRLGLVDFEHWHPATIDPINMNDREEMQRWGIVQRPPPTEHWREWFYAESLTRRR